VRLVVPHDEDEGAAGVEDGEDRGAAGG